MHLICEAILFDMDGTLVDSTSVVELAWALWAARHNLPLSEILEFSHGRPTLSTLQHFSSRLRPGLDLIREAQALDAFEQEQSDGIVAVPGAAEAIEAAQHGLWAVVTSAPRGLAESRLRAAHLTLPRVLVPADEIQHGKPHPESFLMAAKYLNVSPGQCLVFEDTRPGILAAQAAGMMVVGLLTTFAKEQLGCDLVIRDFNDIRIERRDETFIISSRT